jgi:hypothetical protein
LKSVAIRRSPRFGPTAGTWTDLVKDSDTKFSVGGVAPETLTFAWDQDVRADGKLSPKRLLINSDSPYSFAIANPQGDEEAVRNDPGYPCCRFTGRIFGPTQRSHALLFDDLAAGSRTLTGEQFSNNGIWWRWALTPAPVVAPASAATSSRQAARFIPHTSGFIGFADTSDPIAIAEASLVWDVCPGKLQFEAYYGLKLVARQTVDLYTAGQSVVKLIANPGSTGFSRILLRLEMDPAPIPFLPAFSSGAVSIVGLGYLTVLEFTAQAASTQRCGNSSNLRPPGSDAKGKLAFLPNHDYEVTVTTEIKVTSKTQGPRSLTLTEATYFRTKGLLGLNAVANTGDDIRSHVESTYPNALIIPIYRSEPTALAFSEGMSSILPIDRKPAPGDPPERAQMFPLELNIDRVGSLDGLKRLTTPSYDWITAHRTAPYSYLTYVAGNGWTRSSTRHAVTLNPRVLRYQNVVASVAACGPPQLIHASEVLLHEPIDANGNPGLWESGTTYRATVRQKDGPYAERTGFDSWDVAGMLQQSDGGSPHLAWLVASNASLLAPALTAGRQYLSCGELSWDHLQVHANLKLTGGIAGIAVGVTDGAQVGSAILATVEPSAGGHDLVLRRREVGSEVELARAAVAVAGSFTLRVSAFDDKLRAQIGEVVIDGLRNNVREGRVALVAHGPAVFYGIQVDALDIFTYDFQTSRFKSFSEHIDSWDGAIPVRASGAFGGTPETIAAFLAQYGAAIDPVMQSAADPQQRQKLFTAFTKSLGIGLRKNMLGLKLSRLVDAAGTYGVLVESPEPISLVREVTITLIAHRRRWITPHLGADQAVADFSPLAAAVSEPERAATEDINLSMARFAENTVSMPRFVPSYGSGSVLVRLVQNEYGSVVEVYDAPASVHGEMRATGSLREIVPQSHSAIRPDLSATARLSVGDIATIDKSGSIIGIWRGGWVQEDISISINPLSNGDETIVALLSKGAVPLQPGRYTLKFALSRARWRADSASDPEQLYQQEQSLDFTL